MGLNSVAGNDNKIYDLCIRAVAKKREGASAEAVTRLSLTHGAHPLFSGAPPNRLFAFAPTAVAQNLACTYFGELFSLRPRVRSREFPIFMAPSAATQ